MNAAKKLAIQASLVAAVKAHAEAHYNEGGSDCTVYPARWRVKVGPKQEGRVDFKTSEVAGVAQCNMLNLKLN